MRSAAKNRKAIQVTTKQSKAQYNKVTKKRSYNTQVNAKIMVVVTMEVWVGGVQKPGSVVRCRAQCTVRQDLR